MGDCVPVVRLGSGREVALTKDVIALLNRYVRMEYSLEKLAESLGIEGWEEAYEFIKRVPSWIMWVQPTYYEKVVLKEICSSG